jgi:hypothetical protein
MCLLGLFIIYWVKLEFLFFFSKNYKFICFFFFFYNLFFKVDKYLLIRRFVCSNFISWNLPRDMLKLM